MGCFTWCLMTKQSRAQAPPPAPPQAPPRLALRPQAINPNVEPTGSESHMLLVLFFLIGAALAVGSWFVPQLSQTAHVMFSSAGVLLLVLVSIASVITKL